MVVFTFLFRGHSECREKQRDEEDVAEEGGEVDRVSFCRDNMGASCNFLECAEGERVSRQRCVQCKEE